MFTQSRGRRIATVAASVAAACMTLSACSGTASSPDTDGSNAGGAYKLSATTPEPAGKIDSFTWSIYAEPQSLSYAYAFDYPPNQILSNVCESLLRWNADLSYSAGLATKWENPTPKSWVYTIRKGVKFHDGTTMTADDVAASLNYHLDTKVGSYWNTVFQNVESIKKSGQDEVTVTLARPDSQFNQYMAASPGTVESAATLKEGGADYGNPSTGVNCTGPFSFDTWAPGKSITLKRFGDYWDSSLKAKAGAVKFVFLQDPNTRVNAWQSGQVDGGWVVPANSYDQLRKNGAGSLYFGTNSTVANEIVSNLDGPLGDKRVRQALLMATDRSGVVKAGEQGVGEVAKSLTSKATWVGIPDSDVEKYHASLPKYPYDVKKAKALAAKAGVNGQKIVIATSPLSASTDIQAQAIASAAKAIGLDPKIKTISPDQYTALFSDPEARKGIDLFSTLWYLSIGDPTDMYAVLRTGQFSNYGNWSNKAFDAAADKAVASYSPTERAKHAAQAQQIAQEELPWLPIYTLPTSLWLGNRITGVQPSINFMYYPWAARIGARK